MCLPDMNIPSSSRNMISLDDGKIVARCVAEVVNSYKVPCTIEAAGQMDWRGGNDVYFEHGTVDLVKLVRRRGIEVTYPDHVEIIDFADRLLNLPRLVLEGPDRMVNAVEALNALVEFLMIADGREHDYVSVSLALASENETRTISAAGQIDNLAAWLRVAVATFPTEPKRLNHWLTAIVRATVSKRQTSRPSGVGVDATSLRFFRDWSSPGNFSKDWHNFIRQALDEDNSNWQNLVPIYQVNRSICGRCHREYRNCPHVRHIDFATFETMQDIQFIGAHKCHPDKRRRNDDKEQE